MGKELYCNQLVDLLVDEKEACPLSIRENTSLGKFVVEGLTWVECSSAKETHELFTRGQVQRAVALTAMNAESSRSHMIFSMSLQCTNIQTGKEINSIIRLCDLAGS